VQWRLHFDVLHGASEGFILIDGRKSERARSPQAILPRRLYPSDRAYQSYTHLDYIAELGGDFVVRLRHAAQFVVHEPRPLSVEDRRADVVADAEVTPAAASPSPSDSSKSPRRREMNRCVC